jgi:serine/threonine protein kinase/Tfp pilus assembly protein PilF
MSDRLPESDCQPASAARPAGGALSYLERRSLKRQLLEEQRETWDKGQASSPEHWVPRWPTDPRNDLDFASFLFEDYHQRQRRGERPSVDDYAQRFPEHREALSQLSSRNDLFVSLGAVSGSGGPGLGLPEVGDSVFGFRLRAELGRGAFARVFLAEQANLAGRPVVLKISGIDGDEPYTLAQLQHTNVVPIYSVHEDAGAGLRALCMPFFGGASLSAVLRALWDGRVPVQGHQLVDALRQTQAPDATAAQPGDGVGGPDRATDGSPTGVPAESGTTPLHALSRLPYPCAAAWVVAQLADGLRHAHQRGVLHRDIKPSNILLGADGQPMLLDFNLAQKQDAGRAKAEATLGGTVAYMAPEHLRALANPSPATVRQVDHRSDIYSLGMVLYEMLTGQSPFEQSASYSVVPVVIEAMALERSQAAPSVRKYQPAVSWGLESVARKCLAPDPAERYQRADYLAEDLRRLLDDLPLKYAPELSRRERLRKWTRRHPRLTSSASVATVAAVFLVGAGAALAALHGHLTGTRHELAAKEARERQGRYEAGATRALCLVNTVADLQDHLRQGLAACEETLGLYGVLDRDDWQRDPNWLRLDERDRERLAGDTRELLLLLAWARVRLAGEAPDALRDALGVLDRAEAIEGLRPSAAIHLDRARYLERLGRAAEALALRERARRLEPGGARDHYLLATTYARRGDVAGLQRAVAELTVALRQNPRHYWSWIQRGICYQELGELTLAAGDFGTCVGLWPEFAWGHFNLGCVLNLSGRKAEAIDAYGAALARGPEFLPAWVNRGMALLELRQYEAALADFDRAIEWGLNDASVYTGRAVALEGLGRPADADAAFGEATARGETEPAAARARIRWVYGFAVASRLPEKAQAIFEEVLRQEPEHPQALYGLAMLAALRDDLPEAVRHFDRALEAHPGYVDARRYRAVLRARQGDFAKATQDINWCLEREPRHGATLYAAACVAARAAEQTSDPSAVAQALDFLEKALLHGHGRERVADDPDLACLRRHPTFRQLAGKPG